MRGPSHFSFQFLNPISIIGKRLGIFGKNFHGLDITVEL